MRAFVELEKCVGKTIEEVRIQSCISDYIALLFTDGTATIISGDEDDPLTEGDYSDQLTWNDGLDADMRLKLGLISHDEHASQVSEDQRRRDEKKERYERQRFIDAQKIVEQLKSKYGNQ